MLIVVKYRHVEQFAQLLLYDEALRRLDVFKVDSTPALAEEFDTIDEFIRIFRRDFEIDGIDIGKTFEQDRLAFHHRLGGQGAAIAQAEDGGAVGDHRDEIAFGRIVEGLTLIFSDGEDRNGDAWRIGQRKIALRGHRLGGDDFQFSRPTLAVK